MTLGKTLSSLWQAARIISEFKPDIVIGTGGYVCGPILLAAALRNVPTLIQEQNTIGGITNKILSRFVDVVAVGFEDAKKHFLKQSDLSIPVIRCVRKYWWIPERKGVSFLT